MAILLCIVVLIIGGVALIFWLKNKQNAEVVQEIEKDDKTYTLEKMRDYVKKRLDEITKINLYDIGLSEEELNKINIEVSTLTTQISENEQKLSNAQEKYDKIKKVIN